MTDYTYGQARPNWLSNTGVESVTSNMEFISVQTQVDIRTYSQNVLAGSSTTIATASQTNLNKLLEIVSLRGQPVIMGNVVYTSGLCTILLATEHSGGWSNTTGTSTLLQRLQLDGVNYGFGQNLYQGGAYVAATVATAVTAGTVVSLTGISSGVTLFAGMTITQSTTTCTIADVYNISGTTATVALTAATTLSAASVVITPPWTVLGSDAPGVSGLQVTFSSVLT
jgi:hypothetical protein